jgi:hypothetical protein
VESATSIFRVKYEIENFFPKLFFLDKVIYNVWYSPDITGALKSHRMGCTWHIVRMREAIKFIKEFKWKTAVLDTV